MTLKFQVICWDIYYFSEKIRCRLSKNSKLSRNFGFEKISSGALVQMGGATGIWAVGFLVPPIFVK
jgi:hypothetical protein